MPMLRRSLSSSSHVGSEETPDFQRRPSRVRFTAQLAAMRPTFMEGLSKWRNHKASGGKELAAAGDRTPPADPGGSMQDMQRQYQARTGGHSTSSILSSGEVGGSIALYATLDDSIKRRLKVSGVSSASQPSDPLAPGARRGRLSGLSNSSVAASSVAPGAEDATTLLLAQADEVDPLKARNSRTSLLMGSDPYSSQYLKFVDGPKFQGVVLATLLANTWALALETDSGDWPWWPAVNGFFIAFYIVEFALRVLHKSVSHFLSVKHLRWWFIYDLVTIVFGILDFLVFFFIGPSTLSPLGPADRGQLSEEAAAARWLLAPNQVVGHLLLRSLMLTRIMRVVRIVRMHSPLYNCIKLLLQIVANVSWILGLAFFLGFVLAIVLTSLIGRGPRVLSEDEELFKQIQARFADIPTSLFTLFKLTTVDDWVKIAEPVIMVSPPSRFFFIFITFMSWTMLSLLSAIASEMMILARPTRKHQSEKDQNSFVTFLSSAFLRADSDGNRRLDKAEFKALMAEPSMKQQMKAHGIHLQEGDLLRTWDTFDIDESGELDIDELITGFTYLQENLAMKHVANVVYSLKRFALQMEDSLDNLENTICDLHQKQPQISDHLVKDYKWQQARWEAFLDAGKASREEVPIPPPKSMVARAASTLTWIVNSSNRTGAPVTPASSG